MSATDQRTGFRLPWASEQRPEAPPAGEPSPAGAPPAEPDTTTGGLDWPAIDRRLASAVGSGSPPDEGNEPATVEPVPPVAAAGDGPEPPKRRDNPLVAGLVRAMRDAATAARAEAATRARADAEAMVERLRADGSSAEADLRKAADADLSAIRDWAKAEQARIKDEAEQRTVARRTLLEGELGADATRTAARVEAVHAALTDFEARLADFFDALMAEDDPARLAGLAERLPDGPTFDDLDRWVAPVVAQEAASEAPAELADADADRASQDELDETAAAAAEAAALEGLAEDAAGPGAAAAHVRATAAPDAQTVEASAAESFATSRLVVTGLVSVAGIAGFKRGLARLAGVGAVSVTSGPDGEFVFSVSHAIDLDLGAAVGGLDAYQPSVTDVGDGVITLTATEPDNHG
jgi:hypothetical protein